MLKREHAIGVRVRAKWLLKTVVQGLIMTSFQFGLVLVILIVLPDPFRLMVLGSGPAAGVVFVLGLLSIGAMFVIATGIVNSTLVGLLWFPVRRNVLSYIVSGCLFHSTAVTSFILLPLLFVVGLLEFTASSTRLALFAAQFAISSIVYGYFGPEIARPWEIGRPRSAAPKATLSPSNPLNLHCPRCGGVRLVVAEDHSAFCIDCDRGILPGAFTLTRG